MHAHITAWKAEFEKAAWRGPYDIGPIKSLARPGSPLLDAGCGSGKMAIPLARAGYRVIGLDLVREGLLAMRGKGELALVQGDVMGLPFKESRFGAVVCYDVLQHLMEAERHAAVAEIGRVLAPGGYAFFEVFGRGDMRYGGTPVEPHTFRRHGGVIYHYFAEDEVRGLLAGLEVVKVESTLKHRVFRGKEYARHRVFAVARKRQ